MLNADRWEQINEEEKKEAGEPTDKHLSKSNTEADLLSRADEQQLVAVDPEGVKQPEQQDGSGIVDNYSQLNASEEG